MDVDQPILDLFLGHTLHRPLLFLLLFMEFHDETRWVFLVGEIGSDRRLVFVLEEGNGFSLGEVGVVGEVEQSIGGEG